MARIFKVGSVKIAEDPSMQGLSNEEIRASLKMQYPEVAEATIREKTEGETTFVEFLPRPGRKG
jgi:hypothetical protein